MSLQDRQTRDSRPHELQGSGPGLRVPAATEAERLPRALAPRAGAGKYEPPSWYSSVVTPSQVPAKLVWCSSGGRRGGGSGEKRVREGQGPRMV